MILILRASFVAAAATLVCLALAACSEGPAAPSATTPQEVGVLSLEPAKLPIIRELPGRIAPDAHRRGPRARVRHRRRAATSSKAATSRPATCSTGSTPTPFEVELQADGGGARQGHARRTTRKPRPANAMETLFADARGVSQSQLDTAIANLRQAEADVAARKADVARAKLKLDHTVIRAPINGRIGRALVTEGALVGQGEVTHRRNDPAAQPDLCRLHPVGRRAEPASPRASRAATLKRLPPAPPRCGSFSTTARSIPTTASCCSRTRPSIPAPAR